MGEVDALIKERPDNPYFWELKGSLLLLERQAPGCDRSTCARPCNWPAATSPLIQFELAQAMLATEDAALLDEAMSLLRNALS